MTSAPPTILLVFSTPHLQLEAPVEFPAGVSVGTTSALDLHRWILSETSSSYFLHLENSFLKPDQEQIINRLLIELKFRGFELEEKQQEILQNAYAKGIRADTRD